MFERDEDMTSRRKVPSPDRLEGIARQIGNSYFRARDRLAIYQELRAAATVARIERSDAGYGYFLLCESLAFDLIRDIWAFTQDTDNRTASIATLWRAASVENTRMALRTRFDDSKSIEWWGPDLPDTERERVMADVQNQRREHALRIFDELFESLRERVPALLKSDVAVRLAGARHSTLAHHQVISVDGRIERFDISSLGLQWEDPENYLDAAEPVVLDLVGIVGRASYDVEAFRERARQTAIALWSNFNHVEGNHSAAEPASDMPAR